MKQILFFVMMMMFFGCGNSEYLKPYWHCTSSHIEEETAYQQSSTGVSQVHYKETICDAGHYDTLKIVRYCKHR